MDRIELPGIVWHRVSPKLITLEVFTALIILVLLVAGGSVAVILQLWIGVGIISIAIVVTGVALALTGRRVRAIGYLLRADDLLFCRGIMWKRFVAVPYGRMQLVDISRGPIARYLGLSELRFVTAAASAGVKIPGLTEVEAETLRDHLVSVAESRRAGL